MRVSRFLVFFFIGCSPIWGQNFSVSSTFTGGNQPVDVASKNTTVSTCPVSLTVPVPWGSQVTSVEVEYAIEAIGGFQFEQLSFVECSTLGTQESGKTPGPGGQKKGVATYHRQRLTFANGFVSTRYGLQFKLHAFLRRKFTSGTVCSFLDHTVLDSTFKVTVHYKDSLTCLSPTQLSVSAITPTSALLNWVDGGAKNWQLEYGPVGFAPGSGTLVNVSAKPFVLNGLSPGQTYGFRVRDSCALGVVSPWSPSLVFTTLCGKFLAPWTEDFEGAQWQTGGGPGNLSEIDTCYPRNFQNPYTFITGPQLVPTTTAGPPGDHTTGSGQYLLAFPVGNPAVVDTAEILTPEIDLSALNVPELSFWYYLFGSGQSVLAVEISDNNGMTFSPLWSVSGNVQKSQNDPWRQVFLNLAAYSNQTIRLRFWVADSLIAAQPGAALDDISLHEAPTCPQPQNLTVNFVWHHQAELDWASGGASDWEVEYGAPGFAVGSGTRVSVSAKPFLLSGLSANTDYEFYVRDSCAVGDVSRWSGPVAFTTLCLPVAAPYFENFNAGFGGSTLQSDTGFIANCWARPPLNSYNWRGGPGFSKNYTGVDFDHTTGNPNGKYLLADFNLPNAPLDTVAEVFTELIDLSPVGIPELSFWYHLFGSDIKSLEVLVQDENGLLHSVWKRNGQHQNARLQPWQEAAVNLAAYQNDTVRLLFRAVKKTGSGDASDISLDDISIHTRPACPKPLNPTVKKVWLDEAELSWTSGGAVAWQIEYGAPGFSLGSGTVISVSSTSYLLQNLQPNTAYDYYVRDHCGALGPSAWAGPMAFRTLCAPAAAPYFQDFSSPTFSQKNTTDPKGKIDDCWRRGLLQDFNWQGGPQLGSPRYGPLADHTTGLLNGKYLLAYAANAAIIDTVAEVRSELIDLTVLAPPELSFWYHTLRSGTQKLEVWIRTRNSNDTKVWSKSGAQQNLQTDPWMEAVVNLSAYANDTVQLLFKGIKNPNGPTEMAVDDIDLHDKPSCAKPLNLSVVGTGSHSLSLKWDVGNAPFREIEYGPPGFTLGTGTRISITAQSPYQLKNLQPNTTYQIYIRDSCGLGDVSVWDGPATATTECVPAAAPFFEDFEGATWQTAGQGSLDTCWRRYPGGIDFRWLPSFGSTTATAGPAADHTTGNGKFLTAQMFNNPAYQTIRKTEIITPSIDLTPLDTPEVSFWYHVFSAAFDSLQVEVFNGLIWQRHGAILPLHQTQQSDRWRETVLDLAAFAEDTVKLRFTAFRKSGGEVNIGLDDFGIDEKPDCPKPLNLRVHSLKARSAILEWDASPATGWELEFGLLGFTLGSGTRMTLSANPHLLIGLLPSTDYKVFLREICGANSFGEWATDSFQTAACPAVVAGFLHNANFLNVNFDASPTQNQDSLFWDFGDGTFSNQNQPSHLYAAAGIYTVKLFASAQCGTSDSIVRTIKICTPLSADFSYLQSSDTVYLDASASQNFSYVLWDFGGSDTATGLFPSHVFAGGTGSYLVTLTVANDCGDTLRRFKLVKVCIAPVARWTYTILSNSGSGMTVQFDATASQHAAEWRWNFGDSSPLVSGTATPVHTYLTPGLFYKVRLTVKNDCSEHSAYYKLSQIGLAENLFAHSLKVYPNPVSQVLKIEWDSNEISIRSLEISDVRGQILIQKESPKNTDGRAQIHCGGLAAGSYFLKIFSNGGVVVRKVVVR